MPALSLLHPGEQTLGRAVDRPVRANSDQQEAADLSDLYLQSFWREQVFRQRCNAENEDQDDKNPNKADASHHPTHRAVHHVAHHGDRP